MNSRGAGIAILCGVYLIAGAAGVAVYFALPLAFWLSLFIADAVSTLIVFLFSLAFRNASVYDPYWSVQPIVILTVCAVRRPASAVNLLPLIAVLVWGIRLTANWAYTFHGLSRQDWRYTMLAEVSGKWYFFVNLFGIHLVPTIVVYGCVLPAVFTYVYAPAFNAGSAVFFCLSLCAVALQGTADVQMHRFRKRGTGGFIRDGVWKYSRHPNYLGEILMWWGVGLAAMCVMPSRWWLLAGALANTVLFLAASIPLADKHQARKAGFAEYKKSTRMLLPLYKRPAPKKDA